MRLGHAVLVLAASFYAQGANLPADDASASGSLRPGVGGSGIRPRGDEPPAGLSRADWTQIRRSIEQSFIPGALFGLSVSLSGDTLVVGAPTDKNPAGVETGSAYVFVRSGTTWSMQQKLLPSDGVVSDRFGESVSISGDTVVVGTHADTDPGKAYAFRGVNYDVDGLDYKRDWPSFEYGYRQKYEQGFVWPEAADCD